MSLGLIAFGPALSAPFDFDDGPAIAENASIRALWPVSGPWRTPAFGTAVSGRPVANYSFAANYAVNRWLGVEQAPQSDSAAQTIGYHVFNVALHISAALLLFAVLRRTLRFGRVPEDWRVAAERISAVVATLWLIHPIQTEAVDYVSQRTELLVSVCYLGTLYAAIRALHDSTSNTRQTARWSIVAIIVCLIGMGSKEVMISAPLMVLLYDYAFISDRWRTVFGTTARRLLYAALFATMIASLALVTAGARADTAGFAVGLSWYKYLYSQAWAIPHYVALLLWPAGLTFDYGREPIRGLSGIPGLIGLITLGVATLFAWRRRKSRWLGFVGAWFFLLLAPSSSIVPIRTEIAAERRIYLAAAAVIVLAMIAVEYAWRRLAVASESRGASTREWRFEFGVLAAVAIVYCWISGWTARAISPSNVSVMWSIRLAIGVAAASVAWGIVFSRRRAVRIAATVVVIAGLTAAASFRSATYRDLVARWTDAVEKTPTNGRAYDNLASAELRADPPRVAAADSVLRQAMLVDSGFVPAWTRSATIAIAQNRLTDAESLLRHALALHPGDALATDKLGQVLLAQGHADLALPYVKQFAAFKADGESLTRLGLAYLMLRQLDSAVVPLARAARLDSTQLNACRYLGAALVEQERGTDAVPYLERAVRLEPAPVTIALLSLAYAQAGQVDHANQAVGAAVSSGSDDPTVYVFVGRALQTVGWYADAKRYLEHAVQLNPSDPQAITRLGITEASLGARDLARRLFQRALTITPAYPLALRALADQPGARMSEKR